MLNLTGRHRLSIIRQNEAAECGLACLAMVASFYGHRIDLNTLRRRHPASLNGVTLRALIQIANHLHFSCRPLRIEIGHMSQLRLPAILHWDMNHFVVLKAVNKNGIVIHDPAGGERSVTLEAASKHVTGVALELSPTAGFVPADERHRLPFSVFWADLRGNGYALIQVLVLSVAMQLLILAAPFYMQITVDEVIARGDADLLLVLALGFGLLMLFRSAAAALRSLTLLVVQNALHFQLGARLFHHLVRLPTPFFEKRHIGDVLSRFSSLQPIRNILTEGMVAAVIDGVMAVLTLVMLFIYSPLLTFVVLGALILYAIVRLVLYRILWLRTEATIQASAQENSTFIETLRAIQSIKLFNRENEREGQWLNRYADVVSANVRLGRAKIAFAGINDLVFGLETIIVIYIAAMLVLGNQLTVGMVFAFLAYKQHFIEKSVALVERALEFRILGLHLERLSDIALTPIERDHEKPLSYLRPLKGKIELRNVSYRYSETEPFVLENIDLSIEPGEFVTIMGPSGGGKTTLIKVMLGLLEPTEGEVLIDGVPLKAIGGRAYREKTGAVMQEDQLMSGSIADNICFFDSDYDPAKVLQCAQLAGVHEEIMAMPMTYNSLVGDMGSALSGGQRQRVLLARALYRNPSILFLDEGTAHLDLDNERFIHASLSRLQITRISVAHRPDMATGTDWIVRIARKVESVSRNSNWHSPESEQLVGIAGQVNSAAATQLSPRAAS